jgi:hypothetical protein
MTDREHKLTGAHAGRVTDLNRRQTGGVDFDEREVFLRVAGHDLPLETPAVTEDDVQGVAAPGHVIVGHDETVFAPDRAGAVSVAAVDLHDRGAHPLIEIIHFCADVGLVAEQ